MNWDEILAMEPGRELDDSWVDRTRLHCGKEFKARLCYVKRGQMKFCSHECASKHNRKHQPKVFNGKTYYYNKTHGYYQTPNGNKMHRDVWEFHFGEVPEGYVVHHKDEDKTNNDITNLELMGWSEHTVHHHKTGVSLEIMICKGCGKAIERRSSDIRRGQNKFCSRKCSNLHRRRNKDGTYSGNRIS